MDISNKYIEIADQRIDALSDVDITNLIKELNLESVLNNSILTFYDPDASDKEKLKDYLCEDYSCALPILKYLLVPIKFSTIVVDDYCDKCENDKPHYFDMVKGELLCTMCGNTHIYNI